MNSFKTGMMNFPWSLLHEGVDTVIKNMVEKAGVECTLTCFDHFEETHPWPIFGLMTHNPITKAYSSKGGVFFDPDPKFYKHIVPSKTPDPDFRGINIVKDFVPKAKENGLKVISWINVLEDPVLVQENPSLSTVDINFTGLHRPSRAYCCPNNPEVLDMLIGMIRDITYNYMVDGIFLDSLGIPGLSNELLNLNNPLEKMMCFCNHCISLGKKRGIDTYDLTREARQLGNEIKNTKKDWTAYVEHRRNPEAILNKYESIRKWEEIKKDAITNILKSIRGELKSIDKSLQLGANVFYPNQRPREIAKLIDWGKANTYTGNLNHRVRKQVEDLKQIFKEVDCEEIFKTVVNEWVEMGEDVLPYQDFIKKGFQPEHSRILIKKYHSLTDEKYPVYAGIQAWQISRDELKESIKESIQGGAVGVVLSFYDWAPFENFEAAKEAFQKYIYS